VWSFRQKQENNKVILKMIINMKYKNIFIITVFLFLLSFTTRAQKELPYKNSKLSIEVRVKDLIGRMTLEEKVFQLQSQLKFLPQYKDRDFRVGHVRNIAHFMFQNATGLVAPQTCAKAINDDTRKSIEANRWGIPVLQNGEALHGANWGYTTCFPQSIAMAASFDDDLYFRIGEAVTKELRAVGVRQVFAPVINISRDPRWGRTEEGYGEDVFLTSRMGVAYTKALEQGGVIATPKHYVDNYGDGGHDSYASGKSLRELRETVLEPFRVCFEEGGAQSVMAAYNSIDGVPCSSNKLLLNDILRDEWHFNGFVVSDYGGVYGVYGAHKIAKDYPEAQAQCFEAGLDVELPEGYPDLLNLVKSGRISEKLIDQSLARVLTCKFQLGLFEEPYVDSVKANNIVRCQQHKDLALEAARKEMTLLKNSNNLLPLSDAKIKKLGVIGPAADVLSLGDYSGPYGGWKAAGAVTPYQGLRNRLKGKAEVILYQVGQDVAEFARTCDVVIYFGAINEGEGADRSHMALPSKSMKAPQSTDNAIIIKGSDGTFVNMDQEKMIIDLSASGVKTIVVLQNGAPIDISKWVNNVDAILEAWYPGEQGGTAIAEAIFGDINPGGHLPITWPAHSGQIPIYYEIKPSGRGYAYNDNDGKPLYPFGFGLSYTTFEYSSLKLPVKIDKNENAEIKFTIKNTGNRKGDEVVQLYIHDEVASVVCPIRSLKAFKRITLEPGESKEVSLILPYRSFGLWNREMKFCVEPGTFKIYIATNADDTRLEGSVEVF
jgi:beta-glucosidase